jgi:Fic family protein
VNGNLFNKLNTSKYSKLFDISKETASRDLIDLYKKEILDKLPSGGRETAYYIKEFGLPNEKEFGRSKQIRN